MKTALQVFVMFCIVAVQGLQAENTSLESVGEKISSLVNEFFSEKSVDQQQQDGKITISLSTMRFQVHNIDKAGKIAEQPHEEIGPKADGILIELTHQDGPYRGAAEYPQTVTRPYWKSFGTVIPIEAKQNHIHISFSYGRRVPEDFVAALTKALESNE